MKHLLVNLLASVALALGIATVSLPATAADADKAAEQAPRKDLVMRGDAKCTRCHNAEDDPQLLAIGKTKHGTMADSRAPTCTSCHGASDTHMNKPEGVKERPKPDRYFAKNAKTSVDQRNEACLSCHQKNSSRTHWAGSTHQSRDVACTACHQVHATHDKVRDKRTQPDVCFVCHKEQRAQINRPSRHPIPEGKMGCSDCHNAHGSVGPKLMKRDSVNDTCYTCHMEKRGPFVHNHEPVAEDCSNCHNPHGTTTESMLKARPPFLCHQCHTPHGANIAQLRGQGQSANLLNAAPGSSGKSGINYTQGRGCLNCHNQIHGSNNPQTTNPTPQFFFR